MAGRQDDRKIRGEAEGGQVAVTRPLAYRADALLGDVRPLRALFEELALEIRTELQREGEPDPLLAATLSLRYVGQRDALTVPFPLEIEDAAVCLADPLPLDAQALRQAIASFHAAYAAQEGDPLRHEAVEVVSLRVYCL